jgi:hypothetical protein
MRRQLLMRDWGSHSGTNDDSSLLECYAVLTVKQLPVAFQSSVPLPSPGVKHSAWHKILTDSTSKQLWQNLKYRNINRSKNFGEAYCLHVQGLSVQQDIPWKCRQYAPPKPGNYLRVDTDVRTLNFAHHILFPSRYLSTMFLLLCFLSLTSHREWSIPQQALSKPDIFSAPLYVQADKWHTKRHAPDKTKQALSCLVVINTVELPALKSGTSSKQTDWSGLVTSASVRKHPKV